MNRGVSDNVGNDSLVTRSVTQKFYAVKHFSASIFPPFLPSFYRIPLWQLRVFYCQKPQNSEVFHSGAMAPNLLCSSETLRTTILYFSFLLGD